MKRCTYYLIGLLIFGFAGLLVFKKVTFNRDFTVGQQTDSLNGVAVYYNGGVGNVTGRNTTSDGYNLGLKYQCVEFVKRYYYEHLNHKMPDSYGHAKDFFDKSLSDGQKNTERNLTQYTNPSKTKPRVGDLLIFKETVFNKYGHVAIVSKVTDGEVEIIQQNPGPFVQSREIYRLDNKGGKWEIRYKRNLGWLRKD
ncbi:CHAP domain-containing protein [Lunatibacter salilacus]|uniref:CHAP domain-containing protein n=1 Tax=Lunatibacter salilacus TaxID=2483804 RepID=UPI00131B1928|nr:CHAP domain-containing protein [Lunatibacter salilacus]